MIKTHSIRFSQSLLIMECIIQLVESFIRLISIKHPSSHNIAISDINGYKHIPLKNYLTIWYSYILSLSQKNYIIYNCDIVISEYLCAQIVLTEINLHFYYFINLFLCRVVELVYECRFHMRMLLVYVCGISLFYTGPSEMA